MSIINSFLETLADLAQESGFAGFLVDGGWKNIIMILISFLFMYLAISKGFEPLLLLPISFGMLLTNLPGAGMYHPEFWDYSTVTEASGAVNDHYIDYGNILQHGGLLDILYMGVKLQIYPPLIFLGIGAMTDFGPLIANPKSFLLGAAAQGGIFFTFIGAAVLGMSAAECGSIAIIGGADGPTAIYVSSKLLSKTDDIGVGTIALAAYTYMALVPIIQPPIMRALTTKKERSVVMGQLRSVSKIEKLIFPVLVTVIISLMVPSAAPLVGMLMFGNLLKESGCCDRIAKTAQNELMNIITIFLGVSVGATTRADKIISRIRQGYSWSNSIFNRLTACGVVENLCISFQGKINPLSVQQVFRQFRWLHVFPEGRTRGSSTTIFSCAMGPNVAGVIGSAGSRCIIKHCTGLV